MNHSDTEYLPLQPLPNFEAEFFLQILESISDPLFVKDKQHRWVYVNQALCDYAGYLKEDLLGKSDYDFFPKEQAEVFWAKDDLVFGSGEVNVNVEKITRPNHRSSVISTRKSILTDAAGHSYLLGIITDITEIERRKKHHDQVAFILKHLVLGASRAEILKIVLRVAEEALPGVIATILVLDKETQRLYPALDSKLPTEFSAAISGTPARAGMGSCGEAAFSGERVMVEEIATHPNWRRVRDLALKHNLQACWSQPVFSFSGEVTGTFALYFPYKAAPEPFELEVLTTLAQLTTMALEYHQIEKETEQLRLLLADMINAMPSTLIALDGQGKVVQWNVEAERMTGLSAAAARGVELEQLLRFSAAQLTELSTALKTRTPLNWSRIEHPWLGPNHWLDLTLYPLSSASDGGSVIRIDDVTRQVCLEQMMVQTEKIHSLGGLTAGMAHEINNPLAGILQNIQIMKNRLQKGLKKNEEAATACGGSIDFIEAYMQERNIQQLMDSVIEAGRRASDIVQNMLNFCRQESADIRLNNIPTLMESTLALLDNDYDQTQKYDFRKIKICLDYQPELPEIECAGSNLQQVFFNLLKNAAQAMATADAPQIDIRMRRVAGWFQLEIEDNGSGMAQSVLRHIFEPFFTTKPVGSGTGLGLSVAYFIITESHHGKMSVTSELGRGTRFLIELPL